MIDRLKPREYNQPHFGVMASGISGNLATEFESMYESFNALTTVNKQHFVEWFSGSALDSIWTAAPTGTSTQAMADAVDGGYLMTCSSGAGDSVELSFNDVARPFSYTASVIIFVLSNTDQAGTGDNLIGWANVASPASNTNVHHLTLDRFTTYYGLITRGAGSSTTANSTVTVDTAWHSHKIENLASSVALTIDGVLGGTNTTNLSTADFQPCIAMQSDSADTPTMSIRYLEAYNA